MGYTHYWYTDPEMNQDNFNKVINDFKKIIPKLEHLGVKLANGFGEGEPELTHDSINFNGLDKCGHASRELGLVWPSDKAQGVADLAHQHMNGNQRLENVDGKWFAGLTLNTRTCDGSCSYETFSLDRVTKKQEWDLSGKKKNFACCKTAYRPYDLAVNICLIIAKHHLKDQIIVSSDGTLEQWEDAIKICEHFLGYGNDFYFQNYEDVKESEPKEELVKVDKTIINVNDVYYSSWGYDQTNIDYYKVISISPTKKTCKIIRICSKTIEQISSMVARVIPDLDNIYLDNEWVNGQCVKVKKEYRAMIRLDKDGSIWLRCGQIGGGYLWKYDGPQVETSYA